MPWKVSLCFNVSNRDRVILALFKRYLQCGTLRQRGDGVWYYEVNDFNAILGHVIPFFERFPFLSAKKRRDFSKFKEIAKIMEEGRHNTEEGVREILRIRREMNDGGAGRRKYSDEEILRRRNPPDSHPGRILRDHTPGTRGVCKRRPPHRVKRWSDLRGDTEGLSTCSGRTRRGIQTRLLV